MNFKMRLLNKNEIIIILFCCFFMSIKSVAADNYFVKFHKLKINSYNDTIPSKIAKSRGNIEEYPYGFDYYGSFNNGKISEIIETFYFDKHGDFMSRFNDWARSVVYGANPKNGCNNSDEKLYHATIDNGPAHFSCFSVKIISSMEELYGPNFNNVTHIPMVQREKILKRALKQQNQLPNKMFRVEHYFYKSGKLIWVFYSIDVGLFFNELDQKNLEKFIDVAIQTHKNFEEDLRYKNYLLIDFN